MSYEQGLSSASTVLAQAGVKGSITNTVHPKGRALQFFDSPAKGILVSK
jgi:hypothetical protein